MSPDITIMPPLDGEDMAPTKRIDEAGDDTALSPQIHESPTPTVPIRAGPRMRHGTPAAPASSSRDSPDLEKHRARRSAFRYGLCVRDGHDR